MDLHQFLDRDTDGGLPRSQGHNKTYSPTIVLDDEHRLSPRALVILNRTYPIETADQRILPILLDDRRMLLRELLAAEADENVREWDLNPM